jgi:hypothetical protein
MTRPFRPLATLIVALAGACPSLAGAWGAYGPPLYGPPGYYPAPYPESAPWLQPAPRYRGWGPSPIPGGLRISRDVTEDAYLIRIDIGDAKPEDIRISPAGWGLAISRRSEAQTVKENSFDQGRGYRHCFSFSRGASHRRLRLPPDADPAGMTREVADNAIVLRIPRTRGGGFGPEAGVRPNWEVAPPYSGNATSPDPLRQTWTPARPTL